MARYVFGADIGGTTAKIGLLTETGEKVDFWEVPTRTDNGGEFVLTDVAEAIRAKINEKNINDADVVGVESEFWERVRLAKHLQERQVERRVEEVVILVVLAERGAFFLKLVFQPILHPRAGAEEKVVVGLHSTLEDGFLRVLDGRGQVRLLIVLAAGVEGENHVVCELAVVVGARNAANPHHSPSLRALLELSAVVTLS